MTTTNYQQQATDFLQSTGTEFKFEFLENGRYFIDDVDNRDIYKITLKKGSRKYSFKFGQSTSNSTKYVDKTTGNEFTTNGGTLKGNLKVINPSFLETYCKLVKGIPPTAYDVLACLTKYPIYDFSDFCSEFGYDTDSRKAYKTYKVVKREWENVAILFNDAELELLREIN